MLLIDPIDRIARLRQQDVFYVRFDDCEAWEDHPVRALVIERIEHVGIKWRPCAPFTAGIAAYQGEIFLDVPNDPSSPAYAAMLEALENEDGTSKIAGYTLSLLPLEVAMSNAEQDDPEFWENF